MATVVNFIDTTLQAAAARTVNLPTADIQLLPSATMFRVIADGTVSPASITITATLIDIDAPLSFSCSGGTLTNVTAKSATLAATSMAGASATVIASVTVNGQVFTRPLTISKMEDGALAALASANAANAAVQAITDDNVLSKGEKPNVIQLWSAISDEHQGIANQADALGVSRANYDTTFNALYNFIVAISPAYNDLTQDSNVAGATMRAKFGDYYLARQSLTNALIAKNKALADAAATTSTWAGTTGPNKPADNATVGAPAGTKVGNTDASVIEAKANGAVPTPTGWTVGGTIGGSVSGPINTDVFCAQTITSSGHVGTLSYKWTVVKTSGGTPSIVPRLSSATGSSVNVIMYGSGLISVAVNCDILDNGTGLTRTMSGSVDFQLGSA